MIGTDIRKEKRAAWGRVSPRARPAAIVEPEREIPGKSARACARPMIRESAGFSSSRASRAPFSGASDAAWAAARETVRIQPQPHRVLALAEDDDAADAGDALQIVAHETVEIIADEQRIVLIVLGVHAGGQDRRDREQERKSRGRLA